MFDNKPVPKAISPKDPKSAERRAKELQEENLLTQFANATEKNEQLEILKELFDVNKLELITDLSPDHVALITRILMIADLKDVPYWKNGINYFMKLRISNKRQSRKELIEAIKGVNSNKQGLIDNIKSKFL